jgi:hypothetical protein
MNLYITKIALALTLAWGTACATTPSGGGSSTNWVTCETSNDCNPGIQCVDNQCQGQGQGQGSYSLDVFVTLNADDQKQGYSIGWLGESPAAGDGALRLSKTFDSAEAARAFEGTFVVTRAGTEVARETVGFADCSPMADLGVDPQRVRKLVVSRWWDGGVLSLDTHSNDIAPYGCFLSPPPFPALLTGPQRALFQIPSNEGLTFSYAGKEVLPRGMQLFPDVKLWEILITVDGSTGSPGELTVLRDGQPVGSVPVSLDPCVVMTDNQLVQQDLRLMPIVGGQPTVAIDNNAGVRCLKTDGTSVAAIP